MNNYNYIDPRSEIIDQIEGDERLLWADKPVRGIKFRFTDIFLTLFSIFWLGFAVFWTYMAMEGSVIFALFGIPFILVGVYLLIGRYFTDALSRKNTVYALTNKRIIQKSGVLSKTYKSVYLNSIPGITYTEKSDGSGDINFGYTIADFKDSDGGGKKNNAFPITKIEFIPNVRSVQNKITDARNSLELNSQR